MHTRPPVAWDGPHIGKKRLRLVVRDWGSALPTLSFIFLWDSSESEKSKFDPGLPSYYECIFTKAGI